MSYSSRGSAGKTCPAGHWTSIAMINKHLENLGKQPAAVSEVRKQLTNMGVGERTEQLSVALRWMLDGYDKAIATLPEGTMARGMVAGAFGRMPEMAREVLG